MTESPEIFGSTQKPDRSIGRAIWRGMKKTCPQCGQGRLFSGYSKTAPICTSCGLEFSSHQADDAPPYMTILLIGHIFIPLALALKEFAYPPLWLQFLIWIPLILTATFLLLPVTKGGLIGLQWANRMHGFEPKEAAPSTTA